MKKFLSLILALSMIISCVSMVSFVVNAEEAQVATLGDGTLESGDTTGWGNIHGGTFSAVKDPANDKNTVAKIGVKGGYNSVFFDLGPAIIKDAERNYNGSGHGIYRVTFKYMADANADLDHITHKFAPTLNSNLHLGAKDVKALLPEGSFASDTYMNKGTIEMSKEWQTASIDFLISKDWHDMMVALRGTTHNNAAKAYQIGLRLDGNSGSFYKVDDAGKKIQATNTDGSLKFESDGKTPVYVREYFDYYIDDVEIQFLGEHGGYEFTRTGTTKDIIRTNQDKGQTAKMTLDEAVDGVIKREYILYNKSDKAIVVNLHFQSGWTTLSTADSTAAVKPVFNKDITIPANYKTTVTFSFPLVLDAEGNPTTTVANLKGSGLTSVDITKLTFRMETSCDSGSVFGIVPAEGSHPNVKAALDNLTNYQGNTFATKRYAFYDIDVPKTLNALEITAINSVDANTGTGGGIFNSDTSFTGTKVVRLAVINTGKINATPGLRLYATVKNQQDNNDADEIKNNDGWSTAKGSKNTNPEIKPGDTAVITLSVPVKNGMATFTSNNTEEPDDIEVDISKFFIRISPTAGSKFVVMCLDTDNNAQAKLMAKNGAAAADKYSMKAVAVDFDEFKPQIVNGDVSKGEVGDTTIEGWTTWKDQGGTNTIVADGTNKAIKFVPKGMYSTTGFKVSPLIYNDGYFYNGHGIGTYTFSFRARLVNPVPEGLGAETAKKAASFTATICSQKQGNLSDEEKNTYNTSGHHIVMTTDWQTFTVSIPVKEANYLTWTTVNEDAKNLFLRLDASGSTRAFGYTGAYAPVEYMIDDVQFISFEEFAPVTPAPTATPHTAIKYVGTQDDKEAIRTTNYTPNPTTGAVPSPKVERIEHYTISNAGVFKGVEFKEDETEKTLDFVLLSQSEENITVKLYPTIGWNNEMTNKPLDNYDRYPGVKVTLEPGVPQRVSIKIPKAGYLKNAKEDAVPTAYSAMSLRMNFYANKADGTEYSRSLTKTDVIYLAPLDESLVKNYGKVSDKKVNFIGELPTEVNILKANRIEGANLDIGSTLTVNYYATLADGYQNAKMYFTRNGKTSEPVEGVPQANGMYMFAYEGINAQCMGDEIDAKLVLGENLALQYNDYSVKQYAMNKYGKGNDKLDILLADMLAYGAKSQDYQNYKENDLVNKDIDWATTEFDKSKLVVVRDTTNLGPDADNQIKKVGMNISNVYKLKFTLTKDDAAKVFLKVGEGEKVDVTEKVNAGVLYTDGIKATENATVYTVSIELEGEVVSEVKYNVNAYVNQMCGHQNVGEIAMAIGNYGLSAQAYKG